LEENRGKAGRKAANAAPPVPGAVERSPVGGLLSRRQVLGRASALGLGGLVLAALPAARRYLDAEAAFADTTLTDATLQAVADTLIPGRKTARTDLGDEVHPKAIAGVHAEPGAVQADALRVFHDPRIGFDALAPALLSELETRSLLRGGQFLDLPFASRVAVVADGLEASNPTVLVWEAVGAVAFAAFLIAATQINATIDTASGLQVMGHPGTAPNGYANYSYGKRLSHELTATGSLP
jgi:hypothetical protein